MTRLKMALLISLSVSVGTTFAADIPAGASTRYEVQLEAATTTFHDAVKKCNHQPPEMWTACRGAAVIAYRGAAGYAAKTLAARSTAR